MTDSSILPLGGLATTIGSLTPMPSLPLSSSPFAHSEKNMSTRAIDKAARDFEAMFATQLLQPMFAGIPVDPMFGGGHGEEAMRSFLLQEYGKQIAQSGRLGIAAQVRAEMLRAQEGANARAQKAPSILRAVQKTYAAASLHAAALQGENHVSVQ
jgi:peptidoglycan hydrolase FlgJ